MAELILQYLENCMAQQVTFSRPRARVSCVVHRTQDAGHHHMVLLTRGGACQSERGGERGTHRESRTRTCVRVCMNRHSRKRQSASDQ